MRAGVALRPGVAEPVGVLAADSGQRAGDGDLRRAVGSDVQHWRKWNGEGTAPGVAGDHWLGGGGDRGGHLVCRVADFYSEKFLSILRHGA